jgi:hypothetical protein
MHICACALQIRSLDAATNVGPDQLLDLHNEMCYNPKPNKKIILICLNPAKEVRIGFCAVRQKAEGRAGTSGRDQVLSAGPSDIRVFLGVQGSTIWSCSGHAWVCP